MRNLKKFLALVLAMMMAMSLMVTANAATKNVEFPDDYAADPAFEEAIDVLAGMGVFKGDEKGNFNPANTITRAETAAIIYRLVTADTNDDKADLFRNVAHPFTDVTPDKWYAGYVGYLWNAGVIKGRTDGMFDAGAPVTGYEALAMILRAVGYDKNGEFSGTNWVLNVSAIANNKGILTDVNKTNYGGPQLYTAARRDVVASMLFRTAAYVPQVTYTSAFQYQEYGMYGNVANSSTTNPTLGWQWFGLTNHKGIVVGNQATGETVTKIGFDGKMFTSLVNGVLYAKNDSVRDRVSTKDAGQFAYLYEGGRQITGIVSTPTGEKKVEITYESDGSIKDITFVDVTEETYETSRVSPNTYSFDWETGLDLFGHAVSVWFDGRKPTETMTTYAMEDKATLTKVVNADGVVDLTTTASDSDLAKHLGGFKTNDFTFWNYSFGPTKLNSFASSPTNAGWTAGQFKSPIKENNSTDDHSLYLLISNSDDNTLDMVISLDMTITQITQSNQTTGSYSVGVYNTNNNKGANSGTAYFDVEDTVNGTTHDWYANILDKAIVAGSTKTLGDKVAAIEVTGTTGKTNLVYGDNVDNNEGNYNNSTAMATPITDNLKPASNYYYSLNKLTRVVPGTVVRIDTSDQTVYLSDGSSLKKSVFAEAVDGSFKENKFINAPLGAGTYNFTLDTYGNYIYWEPLSSTATFVYGTYLDYTTELASSTFTYPLVYVDKDGAAKQRADIKSINGNTMDITVYGSEAINKRDQNWSSSSIGASSGYLKGAYVGYSLSDTGALQRVTNTNDRSTGFYQADMTNFGYDKMTIKSSDAAIGAIQVPNGGGNNNLFLTNNTQFYIVDGAGLDNQKVTSFAGLGNLMENYSTVTIDARGYEDPAFGWSPTPPSSPNASSADHPSLTEKNSTYLAVTPAPYLQIYFESNPFQYAQNYDTSAREITKIYIPSALVKLTSKVDSNLFFVGDSKGSLINAYGQSATLFTMYQNGEATDRWIQGVSDGASGSFANDADTIVDLGDNVFYTLVPTSKKAADGSTIYEIAAVANSQAEADKKVIGQWYDGTNTLKVTTNPASVAPGTGTAYVVNSELPTYSATTYSTQIAYIGATSDAHDAAKSQLYNVGSATVKNLNATTYPGIKDNDLTTLNNAGSITSNKGVPVSCVLNSADTNGLTVSHIYVNK